MSQSSRELSPATRSRREIRPFTLFWLSRGCGSLSYQIMTVALGWQVYALARQPLALGLVGLAQFFPALILALPAGHVVDRHSRRTVLRLCLAVDTLVAVCLCIGSLRGFSLAAIYGLAALLGAARAFEWPAGTALLAGLVPREDYGRAIAWSSSVAQTATIAGPALGGLLFGLGPVAAFAGCAAGYFAALALAASLPPVAQARAQERATWKSVFAGLSFIWSRKAILGAISLDLFAVLLGGATALLPIYARDILLVGPSGLGMMRAAPAVGALAVSTWLSRFPIRQHVGTIMFAGVAVFGLATCVFGVSRSFGISLAALAILGASDMISVYIRLTLVQLCTPDEMRGRVSAVNSIFIGTSNQLGEFESGVTAAWLGTVPAVLLGGIGTLWVVACWIALFPSLRQIDRLDRAA